MGSRTASTISRTIAPLARIIIAGERDAGYLRAADQHRNRQGHDMNPPARFGFSTLVLLGAALPPATSGAQEGVSRCAKLEKADERLICYDELARATESASGAPIDLSPNPSHL